MIPFNPPPTICQPSNGAPMVYTSNPYDANYLQMAIANSFFTPSASGYKCVDPYILSQAGNY